MKSLLPVFSIAAVALAPATHATPEKNPTEPLVIEAVAVSGRDRDSQRVTLVREILGTNGAWNTLRHEYVQFESGLNRKNENGEWVAVEEEISPVPGGARFLGSEHAITFSATPDVSDAVIIEQPNIPALVSHVVGLSYFDESSGESVMLATVRESVGILQSERELLFADTFEGLEADLRYLVTRCSLEQDVILRSAPPDPAQFGMNPETTRLEVLTEFVETSEPARLSASDPDPEGFDQDLKFGSFQIISGKAFLGGKKGQASHAVRKSWQKLEGRQFLIESVPVAGIQQELKQLPKKEGASVAPRGRTKNHAQRTLPPRAKAKSFLQAKMGAAPAVKVVKTALAKRTEPALVMDYSSLFTSTYSNYTFRADTTYQISGTALLEGTTTFEGGAVIKFSTAGVLWLNSTNASAQFLTGQYRPVIFTAKDDDSVGETISGSTGSPSGFYANPAVSYNTSSVGAALAMSNVSFRYANVGVSVNGTGASSTPHTISHAQFYRCSTGVRVTTGSAAIRNALFLTDGGSVAAINPHIGSAVTGEHLTVYSMDKVCAGTGTAGTFKATNCIFWPATSVSSGVTYSATAVATPVGNDFEEAPDSTPVSSPSDSDARGWAYLPLGSAHRNAGVTTINPGLADALKLRTTQAPGLYDYITGFPAAVSRDTDTPDLGYHYDPIDCLANAGSNGGASLVGIPAGYVVAAIGNSAFTVNGYTLGNSGGPQTRSWLVRHEMVQEGDGSVSGGSSLLIDLVVSGGAGVSALDFKFCNFSTPARGKLFNASPKTGSLSFANCEVFSGELTDNATAEYGRSVSLHNNLFVRSKLLFENQTNGGVKVTATSSTFDRCTVTLQPAAINTWSWRNNFFNSSTITQNAAIIFGANNGYYNPSGVSRIVPSSAGDVILGSHSFSTGTLGGYYLSTSSPLVNAGDVPANIAGLFHFTAVTTAQSREGLTRLDIGYHYSALDGSGLPPDYNLNGNPDYVEDPTGEKLSNMGALAGGNGPTQGYKVFVTRPRNGDNRP